MSIDRFEKDSNFEKVLKEYGIEWMSGHKQYMKLYSGSPSHIEASEQELIGIMVIELLNRMDLAFRDDAIYSHRFWSEDDFLSYNKDLFTALQKAVNSIDWREP